MKGRVACISLLFLSINIYAEEISAKAGRDKEIKFNCSTKTIASPKSSTFPDMTTCFWYNNESGGKETIVAQTVMNNHEIKNNCVCKNKIDLSDATLSAEGEKLVTKIVKNKSPKKANEVEESIDFAATYTAFIDGNKNKTIPFICKSKLAAIIDADGDKTGDFSCVYSDEPGNGLPTKIIADVIIEDADLKEAKEKCKCKFEMNIPLASLKPDGLRALSAVPEVPGCKFIEQAESKNAPYYKYCLIEVNGAKQVYYSTDDCEQVACANFKQSCALIPKPEDKTASTTKRKKGYPSKGAKK